MDTLLDAVTRLPPMVEEASAELTCARADVEDKERTIKELTLRIAGLTADVENKGQSIAGLTTDLACARADADGKERTIQELTLRTAGLTTDLVRAQADADGKENVIKELTCIIVEKDHRIAGLLAQSSKRGPWWRHLIPKMM